MKSKIAEKMDELRKVYDLLNLDYEKVLTGPSKDKATKIDIVKNKVIRGQIIVWYTIIDEFLTNRICRYFFGKKKKFEILWKTKKFQNFNYYIIEQLYLLQKLRLAKSISKIPKNVAADIEKLSVLRNGIAHTFFPENLRSSKPNWKGKDVFKFEGIKLLSEDISKIYAVFYRDEEWY